MVSSRVLNVPASEAQDEINEKEAHEQQTLTRLKTLLQFYKQSEVKYLKWCLFSKANELNIFFFIMIVSKDVNIS